MRGTSSISPFQIFLIEKVKLISAQYLQGMYTYKFLADIFFSLNNLKFCKNKYHFYRKLCVGKINIYLLIRWQLDIFDRKLK